MSFSDECKIELLREELPKKPCCRRAMAEGLLFCADMTGGVFALTVSGGEVGEEIAAFLEQQMKSEVERRAFSRVGRPYFALELVSRGTMAKLQRADMSDLPLPRTLGFDCEDCTRAFLQGVFLANGSVTDPAKLYHMELSCRSASAARRIEQLLCEVATPPRTIRRQSGVNLYYKSSTAIEDVLSYLRATGALFSLINHKIERDIRNEENRATNCVAKNIQKAVDAASAQVAAIERLKASSTWDKLPEQLRTTAELRLEFEDATLSELASHHNPPITKSGLNHRLQKLTELSKDVK